MPRLQGLLPCAFLALSSIALASDGKVAAPTEPGTGEADRVSERGVPALFSWADVDGDGRLDLAAVGSTGTLQLLVSTGDGSFEDVTERVGLAGVGNAALALWADYDADGRLDLFVGARAGASRLFHNEGDRFTDMSQGSGLASAGAVQSAQWLDHDGDGRLDLFVATTEKNEIFHGLEGGFFERAELPLAGLSKVPGLGGPIVLTNGDSAGAADAPPVSGSSGKSHALGRPIGGDVSVDGFNPGGRIALTPPPTITEVSPLMVLACATTIVDQANPATCLKASTTPTLGRLYPISSNLFVAVGGNVGIGTTSPTARLHVAGTARVTDTLTLAPSGDTALDVSTGSINKGGALFIHTNGGADNTAIGQGALTSVTTGAYNTASGRNALLSNTTGSLNSASGYSALRFNTTGLNNTASGALALLSNTTGSDNTASGRDALRFNTTGDRNTASGVGALLYNTTGYRNTASGNSALSWNTTGSGNTASGNFALGSNTTGHFNTASGFMALVYNATGYGNTASGHVALYHNTTGYLNTACGNVALFHNTTGYGNTASGEEALYSNTTGSRNIGLGYRAGAGLTTGNDNIDIGNGGFYGDSATIRIGTAGTHTRAFIAGIRGVTTGVADAVPVVIDSTGQLGTETSSRRFKEDIRDMGDATERLLDLRPVLFRYKQQRTLPNGQEVPPEYGLIAEEVAEIFPDLVVYDDEGQPFTVKYHILSSMLLNEMKKQAEEVERLETKDAAHEHELEELRSEVTRLRRLEARLAAVEARTSPAAVAASAVASR